MHALETERHAVDGAEAHFGLLVADRPTAGILQKETDPVNPGRCRQHRLSRAHPLADDVARLELNPMAIITDRNGYEAGAR
ncbi:MAG: hypothetical protein M3373_00795 [Gemmatimonadota bacterium]|nr:hypothetical protein [Gemmatimonadota bacterium]